MRLKYENINGIREEVDFIFEDIHIIVDKKKKERLDNDPLFLSKMALNPILSRSLAVEDMESSGIVV